MPTHIELLREKPSIRNRLDRFSKLNILLLPTGLTRRHLSDWTFQLCTLESENMEHGNANWVRDDAAFAIAKTVAKLTFDDLSPKAVDLTKQTILDTLGCAVAGSTAAAAPEIIALGREFGGAAQSSIIAYGDKLPAPTAAFINATISHARDFDDTHDKAVLHVGSAAVSAALAMAERVGKVDGKAFITAVCLGGDLVSRMGLATKIPLHDGGWMFSPLYGYFGAMVAAGKILGLSEEQFINAFGIAYCQAAGNLQVNIDDEHALSKRLQIGFAAQGGVMAAMLAQKGLTGARHSLEGRWGMYNLFHKGHYDRNELLNDLGKRYETENLSFRPFACNRQAHGHVDAALQLRREYNLRPDDIEAVTVFVHSEPHFLCAPLALRRHPEQIVHAQNSIPYSVAVALTNGKVLISDYEPAALKDPAVNRMADKVTPKVDPSLPTRIIPPARVEVVTRDGRKLAVEVVYAKGHPNKPMSWDELKDKFRDCATHSAAPLKSGNMEKAIEMCASLEDVRDVSQLARLLSAA